MKESEKSRRKFPWRPIILIADIVAVMVLARVLVVV